MVLSSSPIPLRERRSTPSGLFLDDLYQLSPASKDDCEIAVAAVVETQVVYVAGDKVVNGGVNVTERDDYGRRLDHVPVDDLSLDGDDD